MSEFTIFNVSASGMTAQRLRLDVIASNIANSETTRTERGGPYRRKVPIFAEHLLDKNRTSAVKVVRIEEDPSPFRLVYDPSHPDADENGYVSYPNVNVLREMVDLINAQRSYEANVSAFNVTKSMITSALQIGRG
ncbi:MAG: Flagellar basal-body rod protein FlgC [Thermotoga sp. 50_1627]|uniref:flagellar basal body rod protein FlgC n=1 Tax=Pseudothermotoga sp. TaxID=2033661 RepID=UPI00076D407A|nr:MAG: Flagellar basal-body rod protein FlgC [Thermotoga sp. 50_64]KUK25233.1 MAG: Flagellar basal-body rod protein FlgC [Thermotoga sp. 50_1627]MBC7116265.1 flagellar basal body rod protein FlgC [Pseudothermotoga sp.]MDK2923297.1 flagellar basal-body rod protein FlgC [Pseudothermotoga sp.]HBT38711.1 flagellar basal body rod protein FlgC [Pseudothermotoga sp.]